MANARTWFGVINVNKPVAWSSNKAVTCFRYLLGGDRPRSAKIGHAGTLDPTASGVLVLLVGRATRLAELLMNSGKEYLATIRLGAVSTTDDREGKITEIADLQTNARPHPPEQKSEIRSPQSAIPEEAAIRAALARFVGPILQRPPAHSALKIGGRPAYRMARKHRVLNLPARPVVIHAIDLLEYAWPLVKVRVDCGRGTYVRSLARDIGEALAVGGMLQSLQRTRVGPFRIDDAIHPEQCRFGGFDDWLLPVEGAVAHLPRLKLSGLEAEIASRGKRQPSRPDWLAAAGQGELAAAFDPAGQLVAVCRVMPTSLEPVCLLRPR